MRRTFAVVAASVGVACVAATPAAAKSKRWVRPPAGSITDVAVKASGGGTPDANPYDYDLLVQAVTATGLAPVLDDESKTFTVFAPNDRAFLRLVADLTGTQPASEQAALETAVSALGLDAIKNVLLYHVVAGRTLGPLHVLLSRSLTVANGGIVRPRGITLRDGARRVPSRRDGRRPSLRLGAVLGQQRREEAVDRIEILVAGARDRALDRRRDRCELLLPERACGRAEVHEYAPAVGVVADPLGELRSFEPVDELADRPRGKSQRRAESADGHRLLRGGVEQPQRADVGGVDAGRLGESGGERGAAPIELAELERDRARCLGAPRHCWYVLSVHRDIFAWSVTQCA